MSEPKLISPLLDGFSLGNALSSHDGVSCYPALKENSDQKYIIKRISIPASQVQLDALLLTGAYKEPSAALDYFLELSEGVEKEAACLKNLSKLEGFLPYEGWQTVPMENGALGYEVYLLGIYKHSLEKYLRRNEITHLQAVNLGIDMCDALSAARRAGWIYADLKPSNIFLSENQEFRIGDLGLLELDGLDLASLPGKYFSAYTAPEFSDDLASPNITMDTYALGMILYQIYNNGDLPQVPHPMEDTPAPPANADPEMTEILLKALSPDPAERYQDPAQLGQSLVAYMQRSTPENTPILSAAAVQEEETEPAPSEIPLEAGTRATAQETETDTSDSLSEEVQQVLEQAQELIAHDPPAPVIPAESVSIDIPEATDSADPSPEPETAEAPAPAHIPDPDQDLSQKRRKNRMKVMLVPLLTGLILALLGGAGVWFYQNYYLLMIDGLSVSGSRNEMTVMLDTEVDNSLLTIVCTDTYGNSTSQSVADSHATFTDLLPDMLYKIRVEVEGFHRLDGSTTHEYATPAQSRIASFTAVTGPEDGSVIVNFAVDGPDSEEWTVFCTAEGEDEISQSFTGHMVTVSGLTVGKTYTLRLEPSSELYLTGENTMEFTASAMIIAENVKVTASGDAEFTVTWTAPEGTQVESWDVYCYSIDGYEARLITSDLTATFTGILPESAYTIEVTAAGMTLPARTSITANPIHVTGIQVNADSPMSLKVTWDYAGDAPQGGWLLLYTIDGSTRPQVVQCADASGVIEVRVPAATYEFTIQSADGRSVFGGTSSFTTPNAGLYRNADQAFYPDLLPEYLFVELIKTPAVENWTHRNVSQADYTTTFSSGDPISVFLYFMQNFYIRHENINVMYVIRDSSGAVLADYIGMENLDWRDDMWRGPNYHYCGLDVPLVPTVPGSYTLGVYFNGLAVTSVEFTITE